MIDRILAPLDGSELAAQILLELRRLLLSVDAHVELYSVVGTIEESWRERRADRPDRGQRHPDLRVEDARRHLERVKQELISHGATVSADVELGDPADMILRRIERTTPSLVAMATHGRSGPSRWLRGSVAQRVLRGSTAPLLLVNPGAVDDDDVQGIRFRTILVPCDGSEQGAAIVPLVKEFAQAFDSEVVLHRVWPYPEESSPEPQREMRASLKPFQQELEAAGIKTRMRTEFGYPAGQILEAVDEEGADLVALTTHGSSGLSRWVFGSVAEKVLRSCPQPLLVVNTRPPAEPA